MVIEILDDSLSVVYGFGKVGSKVLIGRDERQCELSLPRSALGVSRVHASVEWREKDKLVVRDSSMFGTVVDGEMLKGSEANLKDGSRITIGQSEFTISWCSSVRQCCRKIKETRATKTGVEEGDMRKNKTQTKISSFFLPSKENKLTVPSLVLAEDTPESLLDMSNNNMGNGGSTIVLDSNVSHTSQILRKSFHSGLGHPKESPRKKVVQKTKKSLFFGNEDYLSVGLNVKATNVLAEDILLSVNKSITEKDISQVIHETPHSSILSSKSPSFHDGLYVDQNFGERQFSTEFLNSDIATFDKTNMQFLHNHRDSLKVGKALKRFSTFDDVAMINGAASNITAPPAKKRGRLPKNMIDESGNTFAEDTLSIGDNSTDTTLEKADSERSIRIKGSTHSDNIKTMFKLVSSGKHYNEEDDLPTRNMEKLGLEFKRVVNKLNNLVEFADIERKVVSSQKNWDNSITYSNMSSTINGMVNYKKFKKANQGRFNTTLPTMSYIIRGFNDLVDFREIS